MTRRATISVSEKNVVSGVRSIDIFLLEIYWSFVCCSRKTADTLKSNRPQDTC